MKKYNLTLIISGKKFYKGIEAKNRNEAERLAIKEFKKNNIGLTLYKDECYATEMNEV